MLCGIVTGFLSRRRKASFLSPLITVLIWILLFLLGIEVGGNDRVLRGLHTLGLEAAAISFAGIAGSILLAWLLWRFAERQRSRKGGGR